MRSNFIELAHNLYGAFACTVAIEQRRGNYDEDRWSRACDGRY